MFSVAKCRRSAARAAPDHSCFPNGQAARVGCSGVFGFGQAAKLFPLPSAQVRQLVQVLPTV